MADPGEGDFGLAWPIRQNHAGLPSLREAQPMAEDDAAMLLARQLLCLLSPGARADLAAICATGDGLAVAALSDGSLAEIEHVMSRLVEFDQARGRLYVASAEVRPCLARVLAGLAVPSPESLVAPAVHAIRRALLADRIDDALAAFKRGGGVFFAHLHGVEAARRIIGSFPEAVRLAQEQLILADVIATAKSGDIGHARHLLVSHYGEAIEDIEQVFDNPALSHDFLCCRLVVATNDDEAMSDKVLAGIFRTIRELPDRAPVRKGMLYNVALDVFYRRRRWATAEDIGRRARHQFSNARARLAAFYIDLYFALLALARGQVAQAQVALADARAGLLPGAVPSLSDLGLLAALENVCLYEMGQAQPLALQLLAGDGELLFDDAWPSVAWPIIGIGSLAIARYATLAAARAYIDRWRSQQWQSHRFAQILTLAEIDVLQLHGRWHEADELLHDLGAQPGGALAELARLPLKDISDTAAIAIVMRRLRGMIEHAPADPAVWQGLEQLLGNPHLMVRERGIALVWRASVAQALGQWDAMRLAVIELTSLAASTPLDAVLAEQRALLAGLWSNRQVMTRLAGGSRAGLFLRTLRDRLVCEANPREARARAMGLTRQETRMAALLAEGVSNKLIARRLGLSLPTVRFHLRNLYRKLSASSRAQAIAMMAAQQDDDAIPEGGEPIPASA